VPEAGLEFITTIHETPEPARQPIDPKYFAVIDACRVPAVLTVRTRLPGDHYGGAGHRKVKKMLLTARIPVPERDSLPVVAVGNAVIWIPGFRPAKFYGAARDSRRCVLLECRKITNA
jgi:tRNA(Ile)-lysidine synthase